MLHSVPRLCFDNFAPDASFHAHLAMTSPRRPASTMHTHDFAEMFYVTQGAGTHWVGKNAFPIAMGNLILVRPNDCHAVCGPAGRLHFINIAFRLSAWEEFCRAAGMEQAAALWDAAPAPPTLIVSDEEQAACAGAFGSLLRDFHERPTRLSLCRFWTRVLPLMLASAGTDAADAPDEILPPWLARACAAMGEADNLRGGVGRMADVAGVGMAHLARTLRAHRGQTPTEFILEIRLKRAATLLRTGTQEIADVALDCGFDNLSYFYRRFRARFGQTPRAYRHDPRHKVLPLR